MKRRNFLQFTGSLLSALGLSQLDFLTRSDKAGQLLAQQTPRKLALLVGINKYPANAGFSALQGCVTDVDLQRQLLIHRFGFNSNDILTLTDAQATRKGILEAFEEHLIKQAKSGDVVVFHFSGHGSQVVDPDKDFPDGLNSTFVPVDSKLPGDFPNREGAVDDIMGHTLFLLISALQTENVTVVLDSCHSGGGTRGNFIVRSRAGGNKLQASQAEYDYQEQWLKRLNLSKEEFIKQRRLGIAKGVAIAATKRNQLAADAAFSDFFAGAFTYVMTQYLWQQTGDEAFVNAIPNIARTTTRISFSRQQPQFEVKPGSGKEKNPLYFINRQTPPAEAVITHISGNQAELWLGGLDPQSLAAFGEGAVLSVINSGGDNRDLVQLESRTGLIGRGKLLQTQMPLSLQPGTLLQEKVRGIPNNLTLRIGLDPSLDNEMSAARQALEASDRLKAFPLQQGEIDCILGRMTSTYQQELRSKQIANIPALDSVGLFAPGLELIPDSFGNAGESAIDAVTRLQAKFKSLLAARIVKLTLNANSSRLNVEVSMTPEGNENELLAAVVPVRGVIKRVQGANSLSGSAINSRQLPVGTAIQFHLKNNESRPLYFSVLVIDAAGKIAVIFPNQWTAADDVTRVGAEQLLKIPDPNKDNFKLIAENPKGVSEVLIIASGAPLRKALQALRQIATSDRGPVALNDPTQVVGDLLDDLGGETRGNSASNSSQSVRSVDISQMAAMSIIFEVI